MNRRLVIGTAVRQGSRSSEGRRGGGGRLAPLLGRAFRPRPAPAGQRAGGAAGDGASPIPRALLCRPRARAWVRGRGRLMKGGGWKGGGEPKNGERGTWRWATNDPAISEPKIVMSR